MFYSDIYLDISYLIEVAGLCSGWNSPSLMKWKGRKNGDSTGFRPRLEFSSVVNKDFELMLTMLEKQSSWALAEKIPAVICTLGCSLCHTSASQWCQDLHSYSQNGLHRNNKILESRV